MSYISILFTTLVASMALLSWSAPVTDQAPTLRIRQGGSDYSCGTAGARKTALTSQHATPQDLAITILETSCKMSGTSYPLGDVLPDGKPKTGDSANFGLFKNNWYAIRTYCSDFSNKSYTSNDWLKGQTLNTDDAAAIKCLNEQITKMGSTRFYQVQRGGSCSASDSSCQKGGSDYAAAITYIQNYIDPNHLTDNMLTSYTLGGV